MTFSSLVKRLHDKVCSFERWAAANCAALPTANWSVRHFAL